MVSMSNMHTVSNVVVGSLKKFVALSMSEKCENHGRKRPNHNAVDPNVIAVATY